MTFNSKIFTLLDLDGSLLYQERGYWIKISARLVEPSKGIPHGVRYSLTLHEPYGDRILGYDNAHAVRPPARFLKARRGLPFDHKHRFSGDEGIPYEFTDPEQLLTDFFADVDRVLREEFSK